MAASGKPLDNDDVILYVLVGLNDEVYNGFVASITALIKADQTISLSDLYAQLVSYEARLEVQNPSESSDGMSANLANRGGRGYRGGRGGERSNNQDQRVYDREYDQRGYDRGYENQQRGGGSGGRNQGYGKPYNGGDQGSRGTCQVCWKEEHTAFQCWKRFQKNYHGPSERSAGAAVVANGTKPVWISDAGATDHITGELEKLHVRDRYYSNEQINTVNGAGMDIRHVGQSIIHTPTHDLHLKNILHVPNAAMSLVSTSRLARDNNAFVEY